MHNILLYAVVEKWIRLTDNDLDSARKSQVRHARTSSLHVTAVSNIMVNRWTVKITWNIPKARFYLSIYLSRFSIDRVFNADIEGARDTISATKGIEISRPPCPRQEPVPLEGNGTMPMLFRSMIERAWPRSEKSVPSEIWKATRL